MLGLQTERLHVILCFTVAFTELGRFYIFPFRKRTQISLIKSAASTYFATGPFLPFQSTITLVFLLAMPESVARKETKNDKNSDYKYNYNLHITS